MGSDIGNGQRQATNLPTVPRPVVTPNTIPNSNKAH